MFCYNVIDSRKEAVHKCYPSSDSPHIHALHVASKATLFHVWSLKIHFTSNNGNIIFGIMLALVAI